MKNKLIILISVLLIFLSKSFSQSIELLYQNNIVTNDTIEIQGDINADTLYSYVFQGDTTYYYAYEILSKIDVLNKTSNTINVQCKKRHIKLIDETENTFCWGSCFPPYTFQSTNPVSISANNTDTIFSGHYKPKGKLGCIKVAYTFFIDENPNDSASVFVTFIMQDCNEDYIVELDKNNKLFSLAYPNPANNTVYIKKNIIDYKSYKIELFDKLGKSVIKSNINPQELIIKINTSDLLSGIYLYRIICDNNIVKTGLISVIH